MAETRYLIVGGGLAGGSAAEAVRERDAGGRLVLVTAEPHRPYDRVPLSKQYLTGKMPRDVVFLQEPEWYEERDVELLLERRVVDLDLGERAVLLDDETRWTFEKLLLAPGGLVRRLRIPGGDLPGIHYLRTIEDSDAIREAAAEAESAVVVGGGFIGCEVAAGLAGRGVETTVVELGPHLLPAAVDEETGRWLTDYFADRGVRVATDTKAARFLEAQGRAAGVETEEGQTFEGDLVVVGVGIRPDTGLAESAGLPVDDGILVNERLETEIEGVYAAGDAARFHHPLYGRHLRVEHYDVAVRHGKVAGANMAGAHEAFTDLPYFFSYQFDLRILVYGDLSRWDRTVRRGPLEKGFLRFYLEEGRLSAVLGLNAKRDALKAARALVAERRTLDDPSVLADDSVALESLAG